MKACLEAAIAAHPGGPSDATYMVVMFVLLGLCAFALPAFLRTARSAP